MSSGLSVSISGPTFPGLHCQAGSPQRAANRPPALPTHGQGPATWRRQSKRPLVCNSFPSLEDAVSTCLIWMVGGGGDPQKKIRRRAGGTWVGQTSNCTTGPQVAGVEGGWRPEGHGGLQPREGGNRAQLEEATRSGPASFFLSGRRDLCVSVVEREQGASGEGVMEGSGERG